MCRRSPAGEEGKTPLVSLTCCPLRGGTRQNGEKPEPRAKTSNPHQIRENQPQDNVLNRLFIHGITSNAGNPIPDLAASPPWMCPTGTSSGENITSLAEAETSSFRANKTRQRNAETRRETI